MAKVYVSSTYNDLTPYRNAVIQVLRKGGSDVVAMEDYVATGQYPPLDKCLADVAKCDGYVGIFAWKYGYIPDVNNPEQKSITELEYRQAQDLCKPCFIFLLDEAVPWCRKHTDEVTEDGEGDQRIRALRQELGKAKIVSFFKTPDQLASLVSAAINLWQMESRAKEEQEDQIEETFEDVCPYVGLEAFTAETARFFKGRDRFVQLLLDKLAESNFVPVIGASGSGKSSLVRAGLIPILESSGLLASVLPPIKPGDSRREPVQEISRVLRQQCQLAMRMREKVDAAIEAGNLAEAVACLPGSGLLLLAIDQFEEVYSRCVRRTRKQSVASFWICWWGLLQAPGVAVAGGDDDAGGLF